MDLEDLTPDGGSLSRPVTGSHGQVVAQFTPARIPHPDELWRPFTRMNGMTADGQQGEPFGSYRPGQGLEHEPVDRAERDSEKTAQNAYHFTQAAGQIRAALRGGIVG